MKKPDIKTFFSYFVPINISPQVLFYVLASSFIALLIGLIVLGEIPYLSKDQNLITVVGTHTVQVENKVARFNVDVSHSDEQKSVAVETVNSRMASIIEAVKNFGVAEKDIQTQSVSVYQERDYRILAPQGRNQEEGDWRATNFLTITLRDTDRAQELSVLLTSLETSSVNGPNFYNDPISEDFDDSELYAGAINDARQKAQTIANNAGLELIQVVGVTEGSSSGYYPTLRSLTLESPDSGDFVEPGSSSRSKTLTVTFSAR